MARIPYIDDTIIRIISQAIGLKGTVNLLRIVYQSPKIGEAFVDFFAAESTGLALSPRLRELLILHTAWHTQSKYEWMPHQEIARAAGVTDEQLASIQQGQIQSFVFDEQEKNLLQFLSRIAASQSLPRDHFEEARKHFSDRELVEIVAVQGFYYTVATLASVFELEIDSPTGTEVNGTETSTFTQHR
jgi:alkylhydroperoxidase family enzyme